MHSICCTAFNLDCYVSGDDKTDRGPNVLHVNNWFTITSVVVFLFVFPHTSRCTQITAMIFHHIGIPCWQLNIYMVLSFDWWLMAVGMYPIFSSPCRRCRTALLTKINTKWSLRPIFTPTSSSSVTYWSVFSGYGMCERDIQWPTTWHTGNFTIAYSMNSKLMVSLCKSFLFICNLFKHSLNSVYHILCFLSH